MKYPKLLIVALAALALVVVGCSKDEGPAGPAPLTGDAHQGSKMEAVASPGGSPSGPPAKDATATDK